MVPHEVNENVDIGRPETHPGPDHPHQLNADVCVVTRVALAEVMQPRSNQEKIGATNPADHIRRVRRRLAEVTVDGEPVIGIALWLRSNRRPLRKNPRQQVVVVQRLHHRQHVLPSPENRDESISRKFRPGVRHDRGLVGQAPQGFPGNRRTVQGCGSRRPKQQRWIGSRVGVVDQNDLATLDGKIRRHLHGASETRGEAPVQRVGQTPEGFLRTPRDRLCRCRNHRHQCVGRCHAEALGHSVLVL